MKLEDLQQSISLMSNEELLQRIRDIRKSRRLPKAGKKKSGKVAAKKAASSMMEGLTPEQAAEILAALEGK